METIEPIRFPGHDHLIYSIRLIHNGYSIQNESLVSIMVRYSSCNHLNTLYTTAPEP